MKYTYTQYVVTAMTCTFLFIIQFPSLCCCCFRAKSKMTAGIVCRKQLLLSFYVFFFFSFPRLLTTVVFFFRRHQCVFCNTLYKREKQNKRSGNRPLLVI